MKSIRTIVLEILESTDLRRAFDFDSEFYKEDSKEIARAISKTSTKEEIRYAISNVYDDISISGVDGGLADDVADIIFNEIHKAKRRIMNGEEQEGQHSMTNTELTEIRESLNLSKGELAKKLDILPMLLGRYEKGSLAIPEAVAEKVMRLVESKPKRRNVRRKKAEPAVKKTRKKSTKASKSTPVILIQSLLGGTITPEEILSRVPADVDSIYIKPEENKAYWVRGDESGSVELW